MVRIRVTPKGSDGSMHCLFNSVHFNANWSETMNIPILEERGYHTEVLISSARPSSEMVSDVAFY